MHTSSEFFHYGAIATSIALSSISVGLGEGLISWSALNAIDRQPAAQDDVMRVAIIGMSLVETVAIFGLLVSILLLAYTNTASSNMYTHYAEIGIIAAMGITGLAIGFASAVPAAARGARRPPRVPPAAGDRVAPLRRHLSGRSAYLSGHSESEVGKSLSAF